MRQDIPIAAQLVQATHAALEAGFRFNKPTEPVNIVLIGIPDEQTLLEERVKIESKGIACEIFYEPDEPINGWTALATCPLVDKSHRRLFRHHQLWRAH